MILAQCPQRIRTGFKLFCELVDRKPYMQNRKNYGRLRYCTAENVKRVLQSSASTVSARFECERCDRQLSAFAQRGYCWERIWANTEHKNSVVNAMALCPGVYSANIMSASIAADHKPNDYLWGMRSSKMLGRCYTSITKNDGDPSDEGDRSGICCGCNSNTIKRLKSFGTSDLRFTPDIELYALPMPNVGPITFDSAGMLRPYIISHRFETEQHLQLMFGLFRMYALKKFRNLHEVYYCQDCLRFMLAGLSPMGPMRCQHAQSITAASVSMPDVSQTIVKIVPVKMETPSVTCIPFDFDILGPTDLDTPFEYYSMKQIMQNLESDESGKITQHNGVLTMPIGVASNGRQLFGYYYSIYDDKPKMEPIILMIAMIHAVLIFFTLLIVIFPNRK